LSQNLSTSQNSSSKNSPLPARESPRTQTPLRFIQAAQLRLDHPWQGVGQIPPELLSAVEDASATSWEFIQRQCYELQIDFLLLTGNTLVAADYSLAGEAALIRGLNHLHDLNIPVYIIPGELDPEHYWDSIDHRLPSNTHRLSSHDPAASVCSRNGQEIATLIPVAGPTPSAPDIWIDPNWWNTWHDQLVDRDSPFPIGLIHQAPLDQYPAYRTPPAELQTLLHSSRIRYFASGATLHRWTAQFGSALWHVPGSPIPFRSNLADSVGCSFVEVDAAGHLTTKQLPTSPVRRERFVFNASPVTVRTELIDQLSNQLSKTTIARDQSLCWIDLVIQGGGLLADELRLPDACKQLRQEVLDFTGTDQVPVWIDHIEFEDNRSNSELIAGSSRLTGDFLQQLDRARELAEEDSDLLGNIPSPAGFSESAWEAIRREIDVAQVVSATRSFGAQLLAVRREVDDEDH